MVRRLESPVDGRRGYLDSIRLNGGGQDVFIRWQGKSMTITKDALRRKDVKLWEWLSLRPHKDLTAADIDRLGFCDASSSDEADCMQQHEILRVALASGNEKGWIAGHYYGSDRLRGGLETFWEIVFHTIETHIVPVDQEPGSPITSDVEVNEDTEYLQPSVKLSYSAARRAQFMDALDRWCLKHPGQFFKLSSPGHRGSSQAASSFLLRDMPMYCFAPDGECVRAALANALHTLCGTEVARAILMKGPIPFMRLGKVGSWLEREMRRFYLKNVPSPANIDMESWLFCQDEGVFLVSLHGLDSSSEKDEHTVAVDAGRRLVFDSSEKFAMRMAPGVFDACVGDSFELLGFVELKRLMVNKVGSGKNKNRKVPARIKRLRRLNDGVPSVHGGRNRNHAKVRKVGDMDDED